MKDALQDLAWRVRYLQMAAVCIISQSRLVEM